MKKYLYLAAALAFVGAVSCNKELVDNNTPKVPEAKLSTLTATIGEPGTKTSLATPENAHVNGSKTYWCAEDAIGVFDGERNVQYTIRDKDNYEAADNATFEGNELADAASYLALYPYTAAAELAGGVIKGAVLPAEQTAVEGDIPEGAALAVAYSENSSSFSFKNVATTIGFTLTEAATKVEFVAKGGEPIAGTIDITYNGEADPTYTVQAEKGNNTVTLNNLAAGTYYFTILPDVTLSEGYELKIDDYTVKTGAKDVKLLRSKIYSLESLAPASDRALAFSADETTAVFGESFTAPTLNGHTDGVVYSSSDPNVATVDASTGAVTLVGAGETTITASAPATFAYFEGEASYTLTVKQYVYLVPNINWHDGGAWFAAYFYGNGEKWVKLEEKENNTNIFMCEVPEGFTNVIFCRMNAGDTDISKGWTIKWNQTDDLNIPNDENMYYYIEGWDKGTKSKWDTEGFCETYFNANGKLYLFPTGSWKQNNERYAAYFFESGKSDSWYSLTSLTGCSYFDGAYELTPPQGYTNVIFCRMSGTTTENNWDNKWDQSGDLKVTDGNLYKMPEGEWITITY